MMSSLSSRSGGVENLVVDSAQASRYFYREIKNLDIIVKAFFVDLMEFEVGYVTTCLEIAIYISYRQ
jgi:hypothetical protein